MPVSALTPYVPDPVFSEDPSEELTMILDDMEECLRSELSQSEERLFSDSPHLKLVKLTDWSGVLDLTDVTLSRYSQGHRDPPKAVIHFLRVMHQRVQADPRKGVNALIDFISRSSSLAIDEVPDQPPTSGAGGDGSPPQDVKEGEARIYLSGGQ